MLSDQDKSFSFVIEMRMQFLVIIALNPSNINQVWQDIKRHIFFVRNLIFSH